MDKANPATEISEKPRRAPWPLWKKLAVGLVAFAVVVALAVGLGVGLTRRGDDDDNKERDGGSPKDAVWAPEAGTSWQIILSGSPTADGAISPDVNVYDLDLYDNDAEIFTSLRDQGKKVFCYFSAGSWENWRDDKDDFKEADLGNELDGWPDERWLDLNSDNVRSIMKTRIELASTKGCDAIDPDNVDGYQNENGLGLTKQDTINYMKFLAKQAKSYNMAIGLKNAGDVVPDLVDVVDFSVNEQCAEYSECDTFSAFIDAGKPVFHIEYPDSAPDVGDSEVDHYCNQDGFSTVIKTMDLDGWVEYCDKKTYTTEVSSAD